MKIIRNSTGTEIELTDEEVRAVVAREHLRQVEYDVENVVADLEGNDELTFESWNVSGQDYVSSADARADFIAKIAEDIVETEELYERDPNGYRPDLRALVYDYAEDFGYLKEVIE